MTVALDYRPWITEWPDNGAKDDWRNLYMYNIACHLHHRKMPIGFTYDIFHKITLPSKWKDVTKDELIEVFERLSVVFAEVVFMLQSHE